MVRYRLLCPWVNRPQLRVLESAPRREALAGVRVSGCASIRAGPPTMHVTASPKPSPSGLTRDGSGC
jgi:hypothetical protein